MRPEVSFHHTARLKNSVATTSFTAAARDEGDNQTAVNDRGYSISRTR